MHNLPIYIRGGIARAASAGLWLTEEARAARIAVVLLSDSMVAFLLFKVVEQKAHL